MIISAPKFILRIKSLPSNLITVEDMSYILIDSVSPISDHGRDDP